MAVRSGAETNPFAARRKIGLAQHRESRQQVVNQKTWDEL
jgi:hypothetical protein